MVERDLCQTGMEELDIQLGGGIPTGSIRYTTRWWNTNW